jgi:hypothetical protein
MAPADEGLRGPRPRPEIRRYAAPFRTVLVPPNNRLDRLAQVKGLRLTSRPTRLDQRFENHPLLITYNNKSAFLNHVTQIAIVIKLEQALELYRGALEIPGNFKGGSAAVGSIVHKSNRWGLKVLQAI